jgi:YhcH/YjgK/YiaL family protein
MIFDVLTHFPTYAGTHRHFGTVRDYLAGHDLSALPVGRHELGEGIFVLASAYQTKPLPETFIECHRKYIDIQIVLAGAEKIGICAKNICEELAYDAEHDFQKLKGETDFITLQPGYFAVFFPQDGHQPQIAIGGQPIGVRKIVVKVPV